MTRFLPAMIAGVYLGAAPLGAQTPAPPPTVPATQAAPPATVPVTQAAPANPISSEMKQAYTNIKNNLTKMADKMPEEHYGFKPVPEIRTFGELVAHVADSQARNCSAVNGQPKAVNAAGKTAQAELVAALKESFAICDAAHESLTDAAGAAMITTPRGQRTKLGVLAGVNNHSNEEYGYMAVYLRLKGIVPPSSEPR